MPSICDHLNSTRGNEDSERIVKEQSTMDDENIV